MKRLSIIPVCLLILSSFAAAQDTASEAASSSVAEELSEEAAILRALVEEYKAKKEGGLQANQIDKPPIPTTPVDPAASTTPVTDVVEEKMDAAGEKAAEKIDSVTNLISNPIESVDSVIPSAPPAMSNIPRIDAPVIDRSEIPPLEAPSTTAPVVPRLETPIVDKSEIPPLEEPAATVAEMPNVTAPAVVTSEIPAIEEPKPTEADMPKVSAPALSKTEIPVIEEPKLTSADKPKEEIVVVKTEIPSLDQPKSETAPAADMKTTASSLSDSIILNDAPSPTPRVEVPVTTPMKQETQNQSAAPADTVAKIEAAEKLEGAAMKTPEKPAAEEKVEEVVAVADKMKEEPKPTISKKLAPIKKTPPRPEDTPLVIATKRPAPTTTEEGDTAAPGEAPTVAAADTAPADSRPEATARSVTPLKDLGRMLFGPKEGGTRGPIFKRKKAAAANPQ